MRLAAGLPVAVAVAASAAGWWLLAGLAIAAVLVALAPTPQTGGSRSARVLTGTGVAARWSLLVVCGTGFAAYAVPADPAVAGAGFMVVATLAVAVDARVPRYWRHWVLGVLLVAAAAFVALCVAVRPEGGVVPPPVPDAGVLVAAAVLVPLLPQGRRVPVAGATAVAAAVAAAALYQLGPVRLGLSPTSLRDVLGTADARALLPLLTGVVVLATAPAALCLLESVRDSLRGPRRQAVLVPGLSAAALAVVLTPTGALLLAAVLALVDLLARAVIVLRERRTARALAAATLATASLVAVGLGMF